MGGSEMTDESPSGRSRVVGAVLGAAIGDALGHPTEFLQTFQKIEQKYGRGGVKQYELWWDRNGQRFAPYTDDTQMAEIVLRSLVESGTSADAFESAMEAIGAGFAEWSVNPQGGHRAPGNSCMAGARKLLAGTPWRNAGAPDAGGCGSVMRAYPFGIMFHDDLEQAERWAVEHSKMTHGHPWALAACAAMAVGMAHEMNGAEPGATVAAMLEATGRYDTGTAGMAEAAVADGHNGADPVEVLLRLQSWTAHEAISAAMFIVVRHPQDIRAALLEGANASGDSDSIATLAGALLGARLGVDALPEDWVRDVERSDELQALAAAAANVIGF
jgi:ADP-ribosylglycohydrolase